MRANANTSGSEEQSPLNFVSYDCGGDEQEDNVLGAIGMEEEEDGKFSMNNLFCL